MRPKVSIIIPFYNQGKFLLETISSAINQTYGEFEIVIVDDGSTDQESVEIFNSIEHQKIRKFRTANQGLSMARNTAISLATGKYILPLDSDDLISNTYIEKSVEIIENDNEIGIVYSHAMFFGNYNGYWELPEFELTNFLTKNCIFCSALFRKDDWALVGGYKSDMMYGLEDYDFWLSLIEMNRKVYRLPDIHFFYRKHGPSMVGQLTQEKIRYSYNKIIARHKDLYLKNLINLIAKIQ